MMKLEATGHQNMQSLLCANSQSWPPTKVQTRARNHTSTVGGGAGASVVCQASDVNLTIYGNLNQDGL